MTDNRPTSTTGLPQGWFMCPDCRNVDKCLRGLCLRCGGNGVIRAVVDRWTTSR